MSRDAFVVLVLLVIAWCVGACMGAFSAGVAFGRLLRAGDGRAVAWWERMIGAFGLPTTRPVEWHRPPRLADLPPVSPADGCPIELCDLCGSEPASAERYAAEPIASSKFGSVRGSLAVCLACERKHGAELRPLVHAPPGELPPPS